MATQNYENHTRFVPLYHYYLTALLLLSLIGSVVNLVKTIGAGEGVYSASLILAMMIGLILTAFYARVFALKAQDRAIRAEENLRSYVQFGSMLDPKLTMRQIIGLRFASDDEYMDLAQRAVAENLSEKEIKKAIKHWKADTDRA